MRSKNTPELKENFRIMIKPFNVSKGIYEEILAASEFYGLKDNLEDYFLFCLMLFTKYRNQITMSEKVKQDVRDFIKKRGGKKN